MESSVNLLRAICFLLVYLVFAESKPQWNTAFGYGFADFKVCERVNPDVVLWVQGRAEAVSHRTVIREMMANQKLWPADIKVITLFFVGRIENAKEKQSDGSTQALLEYEFEQYGDIVQNMYIEHYKSLTYKQMSAINFLSDYCPKIKLAIKMDDDVMFKPTVMIDYLLYKLNRVRIPQNVTAKQQTAEVKQVLNMTYSESLRHLPLNRVMGKYLRRKKIVHTPGRQYSVSKSVLPKRTYYPGFPAGFFIVMTGDLIKKFQSALKKIKPFWVEDSYLGVLQESIHSLRIDIGNVLEIFMRRQMPMAVLDTEIVNRVSPIALHTEQNILRYIHILGFPQHTF